MTEPRPTIDDDDAERLIGKVVLIGITYVDHNDQFLEQMQWSGRITRASNEEGIVVDLDDCDDPCVLPPDLRAIQPAPPGVYQLRRTGREIENPDFLATWICQKPPPGGA